MSYKEDIFEYPLEYLKDDSSEYMSDKLVNKLTNLIVSGTVKPGYSFPNEIVMCQKLNIGRSTLREAYKVLETQGFITRTRKGTAVNKPNDYIQKSILNIEIDKSDFNDLLEFRIVLEAETARLAALRATTDDIAALKKLLIMMEKEKNNIPKFSFYDSEFHLKIAEASHNKLLSKTMHISSEAFFKGIHSAFNMLDIDGIERAIKYHQTIFDNIILKDSKASQSSMKDHISDVIKFTSL